jgi:hypothetical protein
MKKFVAVGLAMLVGGSIAAGAVTAAPRPHDGPSDRISDGRKASTEIGTLAAAVGKPAGSAKAGAAQLAGVVIDTAGQAISAARIQVYDPAIAAVVSEAFTSADGTYLTPQFPAGSVQVLASRFNYVDAVFGNASCSPDCTFSDGALVTAPAAAVTPIDFMLTRTGSIAGRVTDPDGVPVPGVMVMGIHWLRGRNQFPRVLQDPSARRRRLLADRISGGRLDRHCVAQHPVCRRMLP